MQMNFDELYSNYSNVELLIIVKKPDDYQIEAIEAATNHLKRRAISDAEYLQAEEHYFKLYDKQKKKQDRIDSVKDSVLEIVNPIIHPTENVQLVNG